MQNFRAPPAAGGFAPKPPASGSWGLRPQDPHWPPAAGGSAPRPPKQPPHCEFLATRLDTIKLGESPLNSKISLLC